MPQIKSMTVWEMSHKTIGKVVRPYLLANKSRLESLDIQQVYYDNGIVVPISYFMDVLLSLKHLRKLHVSEPICKEVMEAIQLNPVEYKQLKDLNMNLLS